MPDIHDRHDKYSKKRVSDDIEKDIAAVPVEDLDIIAPAKPEAAAQASGDRALVLMDLDNGLVGWESAEDPENPHISLCAPGTSLTREEFVVSSRTVGTLMISIYVLGYAFGPLFLAPLSEMYGRPLVVNCSGIVFNAFLLGCALAPNLPGLIIMRLLAGIGGSAIMTIVSACIGDVFRVHERAAASVIVIGTPSVSPVVGPSLGGFISQNLGWRWVYWIMIMATGPLNILMFFFMRESDHPTILEKKAARLRKELGRDDLRSQLEMRLPPRQVLARSLIRLIKFICRSPIILMVALYVSTVYGILYLMFTTIPGVFQDIYHFQIQYTGLAYLGLGIGMFIALFFMMKYNDNTVIRLREENGGIFEPEMRLANTVYFAPFTPVALFIYAWTTRASIHWIVPCISFIPFGFGLLGSFVPCQTYAVDAFLTTAASAVAALVFMRSIFGAFLPLIGPKIYQTLDLGWENTLLGILALLVTPVPFVFLKWGGTIRKKWVVQL